MMSQKMVGALMLLGGAIAVTGCGGSGESTASSATAQSSSSASVASTSAASSASSSLDASPLSGVKGYSQEASFTPVAELTDEDKARAVRGAEDAMKAFVSGKDYQQWSEEFYPLVSAELQNRYGPKTPTKAFKSEVNGSGEMVQDPTIREGNRYTVRVKVQTGIGPYFVLMHREAERPQVWKVTAVDTAGEYDAYVKSKTGP